MKCYMQAIVTSAIVVLFSASASSQCANCTAEKNAAERQQSEKHDAHVREYYGQKSESRASEYPDKARAEVVKATETNSAIEAETVDGSEKPEIDDTPATPEEIEWAEQELHVFDHPENDTESALSMPTKAPTEDRDEPRDVFSK